MNILIATRNAHKVGEIRSILGPEHRFFTLSDYPEAPSVTEDAATFAGNATKKAAALAQWLQARPHPIDYVLADDSGLEVDALDGAPGVFSARFAGLEAGAASNTPDHENNAKLLRLLAHVPLGQRTGRFRCVIAFAPVPAPQPESASPVCLASEAELGVELFHGACEGHILEQPRGAHGFGYDPLFVPDDFDQTFAELGEETKNRISHRSRALAQLKTRLQNRP